MTDKPFKAPSQATTLRKLNHALREAKGDDRSLCHDIGRVRLSDPGYRQLLVSRKVYGGESVSYTLDRILQRMHLVRVPVVITLDITTWNAIQKDAGYRGYIDTESMLEEALTKQYHGRV